MTYYRQATTRLIKRVRWASQFSSKRQISTDQPRTHSQALSFCQLSSEQWKGQHWGSSFLRMLLFAPAALVIGGSCSSVYAEELPIGVNPETASGESNNTGLEPVEDGSVISNEHTIKWRIYTDNGREYFMKGKLNEAERFFTSAIEEAKKGFGERDPHVASACNNLVTYCSLIQETEAELHRVRKSYIKAEPLYLDAISILEESFGPDDVRVGAAIHNLGQFYIVQRKLEQAHSCYERALKVKGRVLGHGHADYAETMFHLGTVRYLQGNVKDAEVLVQDSIRILEEGGQGESYSCVRKLRYLAKIYSKSIDRLEDAEKVQRKVLHIVELTKGWSSLDTVFAAENLSMSLQSMGKLQDAKELLTQCLDARRTLLPEDHIQVGANMLRLGSLSLLMSKQLMTSASDATSELSRAKECLSNSIRIAEHVLSSTKQKRKAQNYDQRVGNVERTALAILLQSLQALADVESAVLNLQDTKDALPALEAEKALRQCIIAFKKYAAQTSTLTDLKGEYLACLKQLLNLIGTTMKNPEHLRSAEVEELKDEIQNVEAEVLSRKRPKS